MLSRRNFVSKLGVLPLLPLADLSAASALTGTKSPFAGPVIKSITLLKATGNFSRFIAMNSYDVAPKGVKGVNALVKMTFSDGSESVGPMGYSKATDEVLAKIKLLIGKDPFSFYTWKGDTISGVVPAMHEYFFDHRYAWVESAILDGIGKQKNMPVWKLMGEAVRDGIDPYDGTVYFEDIANKRDVSIIAETGKMIKEQGYRAIKIKLGRPSKWLLGEAGVNRDIEAFIALREAVGNNFTLIADANNGYKDHFDWGVKLLKNIIPYDLHFMEEIFPETKELYTKLRETLMKDNLFVKIGEGENIRDLKEFDSYLEAGVYNFIQPDMPTCGMSNILRTAKKTANYPQAKLIPHVWQNQFGMIMSLHASKVQWNIPFVEDSRYFEHALNTSGYLFKEGQWFIPNKPGWGVILSPDYSQYLTEKEIVIS
ncbi:MAG: galactonate dehydratase [Segetibacter sp.]|nr:galactonate dehydratase [Segetibacter sp.]